MQSVDSFCTKLRQKPMNVKDVLVEFGKLPHDVQTVAINTAWLALKYPRNKTKDQLGMGYAFYFFLTRAGQKSRKFKQKWSWAWRGMSNKKLEEILTKQKQNYKNLSKGKVIVSSKKVSPKKVSPKPVIPKSKSCKITPPKKSPNFLGKYITAQNDDAYDIALEEMKAGKKESCWIWFVFPAADFPGGSDTNKLYALGSGKDAKNNAKKYMTDKILGKRLKEITREVLKHIKSGKKVTEIFDTDAPKFESSMKLFGSVSSSNSVFNQVLRVLKGKTKVRKKSRKAPSKPSKRRKFDKDLQRYEKPDNNDPESLYYSSLYDENSKSMIATKWLVQRGFFEGAKRRKLVKAYELTSKKN
jgi:uncharacterized protein (DUF1810 family)